MVASRKNPTLTLIDELLAEQQSLQTPVAQFSRHHDNGTADLLGSALAPVYRDLIPLSRPGPGEQYAFEVDLDSCSGCKACVSGCHSLNGLEERETWRDIGQLVSDDVAHPFQQTVTSACHHCADPACLNGCPVLAYEKDPITGIVRHLDDQCIGCSYCVLKCPYDVPKFSERLGIVRKCDMCHDRLAEGEAPACVQACPTHAIKIVKVSVFDSRADTSAFLPGAPDPAYTQPTTRYVSKKGLPANLRAADSAVLRPQHAHWALIILLVFSQLGIGLMLAYAAPGPAQGVPLIRMLGLGLFFAGLVASVAHLGRPLRAWRIFLGLRRSWLSREAVVLGIAAKCFALSVAAELLGFAEFSPLLLGAGLASGVLGAFCSGMIYIDTRRQAWRPGATFLRMGGTVVVSALWFVSPWATALALAVKVGGESANRRGVGPTARLQRGLFARTYQARIALAGLAITGVLLHAPLLAFAFFAAGEIAERYLYFTTVDSPKMPGPPAT